MTAGILLAHVLHTRGKCALGFVALQMFTYLLTYVYQCARVCAVHVSTAEHHEHNRDFVQRCSDTTETRQSVVSVPAVPYVFLFHVVGGCTEFMSVSASPSVGDGYVIMMLLGMLHGSRGRFAVALICLSAVLRLPLPTVFGLVRGVCTVIAVVCRHVRSDYAWLHPMIACVLSVLWLGTSCTNAWRAVSPATVLTLVIAARLGPTLVLTILLLAWLV